MNKNKIKGNMLQGIFLSKMFKNPWQILDKRIAKFARSYFMSNTKVKNNKILFSTWSEFYDCNPKAIAEEIIRRKLPYELVWLTREDRAYTIPSNIKVVLNDSPEMYDEAASARIWISNSIELELFGMVKKKTQTFIQTWHGAVGIKKIETNKNAKWVKSAENSALQTDYIISNSDFEDNVYKSTFWKNTKILKYGHARNDILLKEENSNIREIKNKIFRQLNLQEDTRVVLYAPTFRDLRNLDCYNIDYTKVRDALIERFGGNWVILVRLHRKLRYQYYNNLKKTLPDFVINANEIADIQELLLITDAGITDYSSWICDYILTGKPGFIYANDMKKYNNERGFYYPLEETPFPVAENNSQLINNILNFDNEKYQEKVKIFLQDKGCMEDGHAAERVVDLIEELMSKGDFING